MTVQTKPQKRLRRRRRVRAKIQGTANRPRISVFRSNRGISAQLVDDLAGHTLAAVTWTERHAPQRRIAHVTLDYRAGTKIASGEVIALLGEHGLKAITVEQRRAGGAPGFTAIASDYGEECADALAAALSEDDRIAAFDIRPQQG